MTRTASPPTRGRQSSGRGKPRTTGAAPGKSGAGARQATRARPVGTPHPPDKATFRRRRLIVLGVLLALVAGVVIGVKVGVERLMALDDVVPKDATSQPIARDAVDPSTTATEQQLANPVDCRPEAVEVAVAVPATVAKGATTTFPVTVTNAGRVPCLLDVGRAELVLNIYSGDDLIWSSRHCTGADERRILLDVGAEDVTSLTWKGKRSSAECPEKPATAKPGTYRVVAAILTAVPEDSDAEAETIAKVEETFTIK